MIEADIRAFALAGVLVTAPAWAKVPGGDVGLPCEDVNTPRAYAVRFPQVAGAPTLIATNFGLLVSRDGERFRLVCLHSLSIFPLPSGLIAPGAWTASAALGGGGILLDTLGNGLRRSADGCEFPLVEDALLSARQVQSLAVSPAGTLLSATSRAPDRMPNCVFASDDGLAFRETGLCNADEGLGSLAVAADARTIYAVGDPFAGLTPVLYRSGDVGATWAIRTTESNVTLVLGGIDPRDPDRILLRERGAGFCDFTDTVALSTDGGETEAPVLASTNDPVIGSFIARDGAIWVATTGAGARVLRTAVADGGVSGHADAGRDGGAGWMFAGGPTAARCLAASNDGVIAACTLEPDPMWGLVARSRDGGSTWEPWLTWDRIDGPLDCLAGPCADDWRTIRDTWIVPVPPGEGRLDGSPPRADAGERSLFATGMRLRPWKRSRRWRSPRPRPRPRTRRRPRPRPRSDRASAGTSPAFARRRAAPIGLARGVTTSLSRSVMSRQRSHGDCSPDDSFASLMNHPG